jgi:hypothetical protein
MVKFRYEWFLFDYKKGFPDTISKPFKTGRWWPCLMASYGSSECFVIMPTRLF